MLETKEKIENLSKIIVDTKKSQIEVSEARNTTAHQSNNNRKTLNI
jgi:hypothetical protein